MQGEDGLDKSGDAGGEAPKLAQEPPGLEGGHGLFDECAEPAEWDPDPRPEDSSPANVTHFDGRLRVRGEHPRRGASGALPAGGHALTPRSRVQCGA